MSKRLEDIKNEYSKEHNYADWEEMINDAAHWMVEKHMDDICIRYAREVAQASLERVKSKFVRNADEIKPLAYKTGDWDGKQSDTIIAIDETGKYHIATYYEGFMDGFDFQDWYDENDYLIESKITHWMEPDFDKESITNPDNIVL